MNPIHLLLRFLLIHLSLPYYFQVALRALATIISSKEPTFIISYNLVSLLNKTCPKIEGHSELEYLSHKVK
jgi:hypothetical protein